MRLRWRGLELPSRVVCDKETLTDRYGKFLVEPFERGYGTTIGNSLRRILLSSLEGAAVTSVKIDGVPHEFTTVPGVLEDVSEIVLNVKNLVFKLNSDAPKTLRVQARKKGEVTSGMVVADETVEIVDPNQHIATISEDTNFAMEMVAKKGRGYVPAEENQEGEQVLGVLPVDSVFSPVRRVKVHTENTRVGKRTDYDRLVLEIWTDGTITPEMALVEAAKILRKHLNPFVQYFELGRELLETAEREKREQMERAAVEELKQKLSRPVAELELSVRASNCLQAEGVHTLADLVVHQEPEMLKIRNFGRVSLKEVKAKLEEMGLSFGMKLPE